MGGAPGSCAEGIAQLANLSYVSKVLSLKMVGASGTEMYSIGNFRSCSALDPVAVHCVLTTAIDWQECACQRLRCIGPSLYAAFDKCNSSSLRRSVTTVHLHMAFWVAVFAIIVPVLLCAYATAVDAGVFDQSAPESELEETLVEKENGNGCTQPRERSVLVRSFSIAQTYHALFGLR